MRITENTVPGSFTYISRRTSFGVITDTQGPVRPRDREFTSHRRSDIVVNEPDELGFRRPSPYQSSVVETRVPTAEIHSYRFYDCPDVCSDSLYIGVLSKEPASNLGARDGVIVRSDIKPRQQLINSAFSDLKDQKINVAMTLAFVGQTSTMIAERATQLRELYLALRNKEWGKIAASLKRLWKRDINRKNLSNLYLEGLFGWAQLYRDLLGAYHELNRKSKSKNTLITGRSYSEFTRGVLRDHPADVSELRMEGTNKSFNKAVVYGRLWHQGLHRSSQLGLLNPVEVLWDVIRLSWVIDQFVHVAGYLSAYDATAGLEYLGGSYTEGQVLTCTLRYVPTVNRIVKSQSTGHVFRSKFDRITISESDINIAIRNPFQSSNAVAAAAVLALAKTMSGAGPISRPKRT